MHGRLSNTVTSSSTLPQDEAGSGTESHRIGRRDRVFWIAVALVTIVGTFLLPMAFPPAAFLRSSSYVTGFNNRVAAVAVMAISLAVTAYLYWKRRGVGVRVEAAGDTMPLRWLVIASVVAVLFTAGLGAVVVRANAYFSDMSYWHVQTAHALHYQAKLYQDVEFAYGPILFYWPLWVERWLGHFGVNQDAAYLAALAVVQVAGLAVLFYVLQQLPASRRVRGIGFAALTFGTLTPLLGMNYSMLRFAAPYAAILWIAKRSGLAVQAASVAVAEVVMLGISPEIGISFAGGVIAYALYRGVVEARRWLLLVPVPLLAFGLFAVVVDKGYFYTMSKFSEGMLNEIIQPSPQVYAFLLFAVVLAPLTSRHSPDCWLRIVPLLSEVHF